MKIKIKIAIALYIMLVIHACTDDKLEIERIPYIGNELRIDGYYYKMYNDRILTTFFFYRNGLTLDGGGANINKSLEDKDSSFRSEAFIKSIGKYSWGVFVINGGNITINRWTYSPGLGSGLLALMQKGQIVNDTTFYLEQSGKQYFYHFRQFSPKPDSIVASKWIK